jgi:opacity protein-like surface antigen
MARSLVCSLVLAAGAAALPLAAQPFEVAVVGGQTLQGGKSLGSYVDSSTFQTVTAGLKDGFNLGFRMTLNQWKFFGHEFGYTYNRAQLQFAGSGTTSEQGMGIHIGGYNFVAHALPEGSRIRPFLTGGGHFANYVPPGASATYGQGDTKFGFNYGGGVKVRVGQNFQIRFDVRQYQNGQPFGLTGASGLAKMTQISAGFGLAL